MRVTDTPKSERMIKILTWLIRNKGRKFTAATVFDLLNQDEPVSLRNVQRDLKELAQIRDSCVSTEKKSGRQLYFIEPDLRHSLSLPIEKNGLLALFMLKRLQPFFGKNAKTLEDMLKVLEELQSLDNSDIFDDLDRHLEEQVHIMGERPLLDLDSELLNALITSLLTKRRLKISYCNNPDKAPVTRTICPAKLILFKNELYFACLSEKNKEWIYYIKVCRILSAEPLAGEFVISERQKKLLEQRLAKSFGILDEDDPKPQKVRVLFPGYLFLVLTERRFHPTQTVKKLKNGTVLLTMKAPVDNDLLQWVLSWSDSATVLGPKILRANVLRLGRALVKRYAG